MVSPHVRGPGRLEGPARAPALRGRGLGGDRLRQRQGTRHPPRQVRPVHVRHHRRPEGRPGRARRPRLGPDRHRQPSRAASRSASPRGIWYTPVTGIWQTVWLEPVAGRRTSRASASPRTSTRAKSRSVVEVERVRRDVDRHRGPTARPDRTRGVRPMARPASRSAFKVARPEAVDARTTPHLYDVEVSCVRRPARPAGHATTVEHLLRHAQDLAPRKDEKGVLRLMLNNKPLFQIGPLDQGWWPDGLLTPPSDEAMKYDLEGAQEARLQHAPQAHQGRAGAAATTTATSSACSSGRTCRSGIRLESSAVRPAGLRRRTPTFTAEDKKQFRTELKAMIDHLRFFPCIVVLGAVQRGLGPARHQRHPEVGEGVRPDAAGRTARAAGPTAATAT